MTFGQAVRVIACRTGDVLVQALGEARSRVLLVAPFIKEGAFDRCIAAVAPDVELWCVTRWRLSELVEGVSDIGIWKHFQSRRKSALFLEDNLHAKYFRADGRCFIGSANLTSAALGWTEPGNRELVCELLAVPPELVRFEDDLLASALRVDEKLFQRTAESVQALRAMVKPPEPTLPRPGSCWLPTLRTPEHLYRVYSGVAAGATQTMRDSAVSDLKALNVPVGLKEREFQSLVGVVLLQAPTVAKIDRFVATPRRFGAVRQRLHELCKDECPDLDAAIAWQTLMRWLLHFLPDRYVATVPSHSEVFSRVPFAEEA